jgi:CheY-specific phosphatase CheX
MDRSPFAAGDADLTDEGIRDNFVAPFLAAACSAVAEMTGTEIVARTVAPSRLAPPSGEIAVVVRLFSSNEHTLVLRFPPSTATALAGRILAGATQDIGEELVRDCAGEIANVIAGQAKATLAVTPYQFTFSLPAVMAPDGTEVRQDEGADSWLSALSCELGEFSLQLLVNR